MKGTWSLAPTLRSCTDKYHFIVEETQKSLCGNYNMDVKEYKMTLEDATGKVLDEHFCKTCKKRWEHLND